MSIETNSDAISFDIARLTLKAGDVLVVKTDFPITNEQWERWQMGLKATMPEGVKIMHIQSGVELSVIRQEDSK